ncbi:MAG TPA: 30S ribosomal protein S17 [Opitutales bacterium]|nr:30S ribosomal protein S17 [Opitutales bacterium]
MKTQARNKRKTLIGTVTSQSGDKSVKVTVAYKIPHPRYGKIINRKTVLHAHDEKNESRVGDKVSIMEVRPLSKLKRWRIVSVIEAAPVVEEIAAATAEAIEEEII